MRKLLCLILAITVAVNSVTAFTGDEEFPYRPWWCDECTHVELCSHPAPYMRGDVNGDGAICVVDGHLILHFLLKPPPRMLPGFYNLDAEAVWRAASTVNPKNWDIAPDMRSMHTQDAIGLWMATVRLENDHFKTSMSVTDVGKCSCCQWCECTIGSSFIFEWDYCNCQDRCYQREMVKQWESCFKKLCGYYTRPGQILSIDGPITTADVLEILKFVVGLPSVIDTDERAACAAIVRGAPSHRAGAVPAMSDALEILKHIVGVPTVIDEFEW